VSSNIYQDFRGGIAEVVLSAQRCLDSASNASKSDRYSSIDLHDSQSFSFASQVRDLRLENVGHHSSLRFSCIEYDKVSSRFDGNASRLLVAVGSPQSARGGEANWQAGERSRAGEASPRYVSGTSWPESSTACGKHSLYPRDLPLTLADPLEHFLLAYEQTSPLLPSHLFRRDKCWSFTSESSRTWGRRRGADASFRVTASPSIRA
jgi:hypothetical protein